MTLQNEERLKMMYTFANDAASMSKGITIERLSSDKAYQYSILYPLKQICELINNVDNDVIIAYPNVEWVDWRGFRNRVFHDYGAIDLSIVLEMITDALPLLLIELQKIHGDYQEC